ncbi:hypothetical protein DBR17_06535, partial [Sphingomonas sp. HMWF008]
MVAGLSALALAAPGSEETTPSTPASIVIKQDTPVELMATAEVTTATAKPGTVFKMRVNRAILVDGKTIIPVGTPAFGEVTAAKDAGGLGKSGKMAAKLVRIQLGDAAIPIEGNVESKGSGAGSAGLAILATGWMGVFHRGNNAKIKAGEILTGFVSEDVAIDLL